MLRPQKPPRIDEYMKNGLPANTTLSHYRVLAPLGAGGMGEVYLAEDERLRRRVALKVLPDSLAQDADRLRRFEQEAFAASALNHPNILTIYEFGVEGTTHFLASEFIDGETLRDRLQRAPLPLNETLDIAMQTAQALAAAHEANIIHRDIKPENVMLRKDGIVKVLDFGLAKQTELRSFGVRNAECGVRNEEDAETLMQSPQATPRSALRTPHSEAPQSTMPGAVMGTASYMSPEQARGEKVDGRSDLFSLGIVLYEMLTGRRPFEGVNMIDVLGAILRESPATLAADIPDELQRIVTKALQKYRTARYATANELLADLKNLQEELAFVAKLSRTPSLKEQAAPSPSAFVVPPSGGEVRQPSQPPEGGTTNARFTSRKVASALVTIAVLVIALVAAFFYFSRKPVLTDKDTILLADFTNTTGDSVFDGTLKQALAVHLGQSPFLNLFADERVRETLRLMNKSPDERVTPTVGREICQRQGLKALLTGTIASLGRNYVINLEAVNGQTGDVLAREQGEAEGKEQVLRTLGEAATRLREKLGESLSSIQKFDAPLEQVTTSSLEALKAYSLGTEQSVRGKLLEAIPFCQRAVELDPNFAYAHAGLASLYADTNQPGLAAEWAEKAFALKDQASAFEKLRITYWYYVYVTGETDKAIEALEMSRQTYPHDYRSPNSLAFRYWFVGQFEKGLEAARESLRLNPNYSGGYSGAGRNLIRLNRFAEAKEICEQAVQQKHDNTFVHTFLYQLAFISGEASAMQQQIDWTRGKLDEYVAFDWQAGAAAFGGQWKRAQEFSNRAAELAQQRSLQEETGNSMSSNAEWAAVLGHCPQSRAELARAAALPRTPTSLFRAGMAQALCGAAAQAQTMNDEAVKRYPKSTIVNEIYLPLIRAALEVQRGNRTQVIQILSAASRYENVSNFYQNYLRGQAYLGERNGAAAASEFQKILDHRGWSPTPPLYPLAHLGLGRAMLLQGDTAKAKQSYDEFFRLWKDADADLPVLIEAKQEYAKV